MNTNVKLACAVGLGAAVQLAMAYELAATATRDNVKDYVRTSVDDGGLRTRRLIPRQPSPVVNNAKPTETVVPGMAAASTQLTSSSRRRAPSMSVPGSPHRNSSPS